MKEMLFTCPGNFQVNGIETRGTNQFAVALKCLYPQCGDQRTCIVNGYIGQGVNPQQDAISNAESEMAIQCRIETMING